MHRSLVLILAVGILVAFSFAGAVAQDKGLIERIAALEKELEPLKSAVIAFEGGGPNNDCPLGWGPYAPAGGRTIVGAGEHQNLDQNGKALPKYSGRPDLREEDVRDPRKNDLFPKTAGGEEKHTLMLEEMPNHGHPFTGTPVSRGGNSAGSDRVLAIGSEDRNYGSYTPSGVVGKAGGTNTGKTQPHDDMPPYIALYFCKKD